MAKHSKIAWTDSTLNFWIGCAKVSPACKHCYAEVSTPARTSRARKLELWGETAARQRTSAANWKQAYRWDRDARDARLLAAIEGKPAPQPPRVFCNSLSDFFEDRRDLDPWRADAIALIEACKELTFLLLTKRIDRVMDLVPERWRVDGFPKNVWIGTTAESQEWLGKRAPHLLRIPSVVRFVSLEPQVSAIDVSTYVDPDLMRRIDWVIQGGESGHHARPFDLAWARATRDVCKAAGVDYFFKQTGAVIVAPELFELRSEKPGRFGAEWSLMTPEGDKAASFWQDPLGRPGYTVWQTWDVGGVGGENADDRTLEKAIDEARGALRRQAMCAPFSWHALTPKDRAGADPEEWAEDLRVREVPRAAA
jgi:protein gp37